MYIYSRSLSVFSNQVKSDVHPLCQICLCRLSKQRMSRCQLRTQSNRLSSCFSRCTVPIRIQKTNRQPLRHYLQRIAKLRLTLRSCTLLEVSKFVYSFFARQFVLAIHRFCKFLKKMHSL